VHNLHYTPTTLWAQSLREITTVVTLTKRVEYQWPIVHVYLPLNTTSLLQSMDQETLSKAYRLNTTLKEIAEAIPMCDAVTLRD
jgi:hypothetical protein